MKFRVFFLFGQEVQKLKYAKFSYDRFSKSVSLPLFPLVLMAE